MTIDLPPQIARIVEDALRSGQYRSAEDVLAEAITHWQIQHQTEIPSVEAQRREAIERLKTFGKMHGLSLAGMTIRELRDEARP